MLPGHVETIGKYQKLAFLGKGGMGEVYLAFDNILERHVAIKTLRQTNQPQGLLRNEARLLAKLNHPNIVQIYDLIEIKEKTALVMEYVKGITLDDAIQGHCFSITEAFNWLCAITEGLTTAHAQGIIHRDLKPENILINEKSQIKISDFGIAKYNNQIRSKESNLKGSFKALSPEQIQGEQASQASDLFSLGVIAYQLLLGSHPFGKEDNPAALMYNIVNKEPLFIEKNATQLPSEIISILKKLLNKRPDERFSSAKHVLYALREFSIEAYEEKFYSFNETLDISKDQAIVDNAKNTSKKPRQPPFLTASISHFWSLSLLILFLGLTLIVYYKIVPYVSSSSNYFIAVLDTKVILENTYIDRLQLPHIVKDAVEQAVIQLPDHYLTSLDHIDSSTIKNIGEDFAVDYIIQPSIHCLNGRCETSLELLEKENWNIVGKKRWPVLLDDHFNTYVVSQEYVYRLLDDATPNTHIENTISEIDYLHYLELMKKHRKSPSNYQEILKETEKILTSSPRFIPLYDLYSRAAQRAYTETKNIRFINELRYWLERAKRILPENYSLLSHWFMLLMIEKDYHNAKIILTRMEKLGVPEAIILDKRAFLQFYQGKFAKAAQIYERSLQAQPSPSSLAKVAASYWLSGNTQKAKSALERLLVISPQHYNGLTLSAKIAALHGDTDQAEKFYRKLIDNDPNNLNVYLDLGKIYFLRKNYPQAKFFFEHAQSKQKPEFILNLAEVEWMLGNKEKAHQLYRELIKKADQFSSMEHVVLTTSAAQAHAHLGEYQDAIEDIQQLLARQPQDPHILYAASLVYSLTQESHSAWVFTRKAINAGVGKIWFTLPWFSTLCYSSEYISLFDDTQYKPTCTWKANTAAN